MRHVIFSAVHRGRGLLRPAVSVHEEEREAHRRGDAVGGPARYGQAEARLVGGSEVTGGTVFGTQSSFCCLDTKNGHLLSSFHLGGKEENRSIQIKSSPLLQG